MSTLKTLFKNKLFLLGLLIPIIWQVVYFSIAIPAVNHGDTGVFNLKVTVVNEDAAAGRQIAGQLSTVLPFQTGTSDGLEKALEDMDKGDGAMVIHIPGDFTTGLQQGKAQVAYYINQAVPSMTKQLMETAARTINEALNANAFTMIKDNIQQNIGPALGKMGLPEATVKGIGQALAQAFSALKASPVYADIQKVNDNEGFVQTAFPLYIFLTYFIGSVVLAVTHSQAYKAAGAQISQGKLYLTSLVVNIIYALIIPGIVIAFAAGFGVTFSEGWLASWMLLALGLFTFISLFQMLFKWLGLIGTGVMILLLFPLQLISSGLIYPREILPAFYRAAGDYLPATYFADGILKATYGGTTLPGIYGALALMAVIFMAVTALALLRKNRPAQA